MKKQRGYIGGFTIANLTWQPFASGALIGTPIDVEGFLPDVRSILLLLEQAGADSDMTVNIRLGHSAAIESSGYVFSVGGTIGNAMGSSAFGIAVIVPNVNNANIRLMLEKSPDNPLTWIASSFTNNADFGNNQTGNGFKTLAGPLTRIQIRSVVGLFNAGTYRVWTRKN
jgi:hypothetical protein